MVHWHQSHSLHRYGNQVLAIWVLDYQYIKDKDFPTDVLLLHIMLTLFQSLVLYSSKHSS